MTIAALQTPTPAALQEQIVRMIAQLSTVRAAEIKPQDRLREDLGLDSVCSMELLSMLAEQLDLDVQMEEAMQVTTVQGVTEMAARHLALKAKAV